MELKRKHLVSVAPAVEIKLRNIKSNYLLHTVKIQQVIEVRNIIACPFAYLSFQIRLNLCYIFLYYWVR